MKKGNFITRFLLTCAGVDYQTIMQTTSSEINKYKTIGTVVLIPALLALLSGYYAMYIVSQNLRISLIFAPFWAMIIFIIDRAIVANMRPGEFGLGVFGRIMLSLIIAVVISMPLKLKIFEDAIEEKRFFSIVEKQGEVSSEYNYQIREIREESRRENARVNELLTSYIQEVDGTGGSGVPHRGPIARIKEAVYLQAREIYNQNELIRQERIVSLEERREIKRQLVANTDADRLLGSMMILGELQNENSTVKWATWFILLFACMIELIPILIKLGMSKDKRLYHEILEMNDEACLEQRRLSSGELMELKRIEQSVAMEAEKLRILTQSIRNTLDWKWKDYEYFIDKISATKDKHLKLKTSIIEKVEEGVFKEQVLAQLSNAYNGYIEVLESLVAKSKQYNWNI